VIDYHGREDIISITEDCLYMYNEILYSRHKETEHTPLDLSQLSLSTDSDIDDGSVNLSINNHYFSNNGSAGHCSQSNTSRSHCTSFISSTPTPTNDNV